jgi:phosphate transport system substrate-binding protein
VPTSSRHRRKNKIMKKKTLALILSLAMSATMLAACAAEAQMPDPAPAPVETVTTTDTPAVTTETTTTTEEAPATKPIAVSGTISMAGSTSMERMANATKEDFESLYPQVTVTAEFTGSGAGIEAVLAGTVDIGNSSRNLKDTEIEAGAVENIVAIDGIAVIVSQSNSVAGLTKDELKAIYLGEIRNWSEVGGADDPVVVVGREAGSGTRGAFEEILGVADECAYANELDSTGAVVAQVASTSGAIGYVSLDVAETASDIIVLALEGVEANAANVKSGSYFLSRPFVMATKGPISAQSDVVQAFFAYLASEQGKAVIAQIGLVNVD